MELELLKLFFPEELVAHFDITGSAIKQGKHGDYLEVEFTNAMSCQRVIQVRSMKPRTL